MSIHIEYKGRTGNNIFQYVFARIIAENNNLSISAKCPPILTPQDLRQGSTIKTPSVTVNDDNASDFIDKKGLRSRINIKGFFQNRKLYTDRKRIQSFFKLEGSKNTDDIVAHVRIGDYKTWRKGVVISPSWYHNILKSETFNRLFFVTDEPKSSFFHSFRDYNPTIISSSHKNDFHFIRNFDKILCSNSTFCWWAAFLSTATKLYMFKNWVFRKGPHKYVDLVPIEGALIRDGKFC